MVSIPWSKDSSADGICFVGVSYLEDAVTGHIKTPGLRHHDILRRSCVSWGPRMRLLVIAVSSLEFLNFLYASEALVKTLGLRCDHVLGSMSFLPSVLAHSTRDWHARKKRW